MLRIDEATIHINGKNTDVSVLMDTATINPINYAEAIRKYEARAEIIKICGTIADLGSNDVSATQKTISYFTHFENAYVTFYFSAIVEKCRYKWNEYYKNNCSKNTAINYIRDSINEIDNITKNETFGNETFISMLAYCKKKISFWYTDLTE